jgi:predicted  nucleic acid-binding Zn-ribbon protein
MPHQFDLLPIELQASVVELRAAGVADDAIDNLITRTLKALASKRNKLQVEVLDMEEHLSKQLQQIGDKLQADLQTQHGATNTMLADLNTAWLNAKPMIEEAGRGIADLKKQWRELEHWRSRIEAAILSLTEFREESTNDRQQIRDAVTQQDERHERQIAEVLQELRAFGQRLFAIEQLLEVAGEHEAGG